MPKISIIMPTYNVEKYFRQCMDSVINQTLEDIEIIPVDDGSPDNCGRIMDEYAAKDSRIKPIHKPNGGYGTAVNAGIEAATGEYIGIIETDDYIEPDMYEKLYNQAKRFDADVCKCGFYEYNSNFPDNKKDAKWIKDVQNLDFFPENESFTILEYPLLMAFHASIWTNIYKKEFMNEYNIRLSESESASYQDFPFMAEVMCKARKIAVLKDYLYHWRVEDGMNSSTKRNDERLSLMAERSEEVKKIIKASGMYDSLKEEIYKHFIAANLDFYKAISFKHKKMYFEKLYKLFEEIKEDKSFKFKYFSKKEKSFFNKVISNNFLSTLSLKTFIKPLISLRLNKKEISLRIFNTTIIRRYR